jgi:hypothetical protein
MNPSKEPHMHPRTAHRKRLATATALAAGALLALPASGMAAQSFGSGLGNGPANGPMECAAPPVPCTFVAHLQSGNGDGMKPRPAPIDGVVVKFRIRSATPDVVTFRLANISVQGLIGTASAVGIGPTVTLAGTEEIEEFPARVPVTKGAHVALDGTSHGATYDSSGGRDTYLYAPPLAQGQAARTTTETSGGELLVQAVMEPDSDRDGFGDETQDSCPTDAGTQQGACPQPDVKKPRLSGLSILPKAFKSSSKVLYRLSETATVTFKVEKARKGRKARGKCRKQTAANRLRKRCTRWVKLRGSIKTTGGSGLNEVTLKARIGGRKLGPGRYRLVATARDKAGNKSAVKRTGFRIKR